MGPKGALKPFPQASLYQGLPFLKGSINERKIEAEAFLKDFALPFQR